MRILPRTHEDVNEEWISDKTRFVWDGLKSQRLDRPYVREFGKLRAAGWQEAFLRIAQRLKGTRPERIGIILGDLVAAEEAFSARQFADQLGIKNIDCRQDGSPLGSLGGRAGYLFNTGIAGIEEADSILLIGTNPRLEAPVLNARIRKRLVRGGCTISVIGERADLTYPYTYLGAGPDTLNQFLASEQPSVAKPMVIVGQGALDPCRWRRRFWPRPGRRRRSWVPSRMAGTASTCCTRRLAASARSTSARCRRPRAA